MSARLAEIRRHPIKGLGAERLATAGLVPGQGLAWDRTWAVAHGGSAFDPDRPAWVRRSNFVVVAQVPRLARAMAAYDAPTGRLTLDHPEAERIEIDPGTPAGAAGLTAWIAPLAAGGRPGPYRLARLPGAALTDTEGAHLSLLSTRALAVLSERAGRALDRHRFRANLWIDGLAPWEEFDWVGREIAIGPVRLAIRHRIDRCSAINACPASGLRDVDLPGLLDAAYGHVDFGVAARVVAGGRIAPGDVVERP